MSAANVVRAIAASDINVLNEALKEMSQDNGIRAGNLYRAVKQNTIPGNNRPLNNVTRKAWNESQTPSANANRPPTLKNLQGSVASELNEIFTVGGKPHTLLDEALQVAAEEAGPSNKGHPSVEIVKILVKHGAKTYYQLTRPAGSSGIPLAKKGTRTVNPLTGIRSLGGRRSHGSRLRLRRSHSHSTRHRRSTRRRR
jgi:hypothetical protein